MIIRTFALCTVFAVAAAAASTSTVTFHKDVEPILQRNCQTCHRPGEAAPMSFLSYKDVRPWAKDIREAVVVRKMPPWYADPHYGKFDNDRTLSQKDIDTVVAWVDAGAPEGAAKDAPIPVAWTEGWAIGKPDAVIRMTQPFKVQAAGVIEYQYMIVPSGFTEDKWVQAAEARPGNRQVVHHIIAFIRSPDSKYLREYPVGVPFVPDKKARQRNRPNQGEGQNGEAEKGEQPRQGGGNNEAADATAIDFLQGFAPGLPPAVLRPGQAKLVKAGSDIIFQMHYTANGTPGEDQSMVGLIFAKEPPKERIVTMNASNPKFKIPPGDGNYKVESEFTLQRSGETGGPDAAHASSRQGFRIPPGLSRWPDRNHPERSALRFQLAAFLLPGRSKRIFPRERKLECTAHFDNSPNNKANPDATKEVAWGDQSWEEMMIGWFDVAIPVGQVRARSIRSVPRRCKRPSIRTNRCSKDFGTRKD